MTRFSNEEPRERLPQTSLPEEEAYKDALHSAITAMEEWRREGDTHMKEERKRDALALVNAAMEEVREHSLPANTRNAVETLKAELENRPPRYSDGGAGAVRDLFMDHDN